MNQSLWDHALEVVNDATRRGGNPQTGSVAGLVLVALALQDVADAIRETARTIEMAKLP